MPEILLKRWKASDFSLLALLGALLAFIYYPTFVWMAERWFARDSYYGHGILIPLVSLYWIVKKRKEWTAFSANPKMILGVVLLILGGALQIWASFFRVYFFSAFSLVLVLLGMTALLFGKECLRSVWFPILFLMLMVPLPLLLISQTTLKMKFFVSEVSAHLVNQIGIRAVREGSYILTPHSFLLVGDPCSGLRSFLAFVCLGFVFAYESKTTFARRVILVASGLPLAILSNIIRVFSLTVLAEIYGRESIEGFIHDASGLVVFIFAFLVFMALRKKLELRHA